MTDPSELQSDRDAEAQRQAALVKRKQEIDDIRWLMAHPQGRRIVTRIFEKTGTRRTPFNTNGSTMAFNAGMQNVGLWLEAEVVEQSPDGYMKLLKEFTRD
jgi:3-oxoacyl-[acyl-carrier-protein] synthase III